MSTGLEGLSEEQVTALAKAARKLLHSNDATVSKEAKRLLMKADPTIKFADVQAEDAIGTELTKRDEQITELRNKLIEQDALRNREACHARAREKGLDPAAVEKTVVDYKVMDWDKAMEITERLQTMAPSSPEPEQDRLNRMPDDKDLLANPDKWAREMAHKSITEQLRARPRAAAAGR